MQLVQVLDLALEVLALGALRRRCGRSRRRRRSSSLAAARRSRSRSLSSSRRDTPTPSPCGHVHEVAARDRELHRQARALRLQRVLDRLDEDLLARLEQLGDALALRAAAAAAAGDLDAREHDVVGVQEAVLLEPDVDERRLEPGQDVVDLALVDVSDDRARSAALYVELRDAPVVALASCAPRARERLSPPPSAAEGEPSDSRIATLVSPRSTVTSNCFFKGKPSHEASGPWRQPFRAPARGSTAGGRWPSMS